MVFVQQLWKKNYIARKKYLMKIGKQYGIETI